MTGPSAPHKLLRASAGTGKTYQLVEAYVRFIEVDKLRPAQIVAITFTRKAAFELRLRIRAKLMALGAPAPVLAELTRAPLGNFHGLALQLMSSFGLDAQLSGPLRVLAAAGEDRALFQEACQDVWFAGDAQAAEAVGVVASYLRVGDTLPQALWQAIALAREDDVPISAKLMHPNFALSRLADVHNQLVQMRAELVAAGTELTAKAVAYLEKFKNALVPPCPEIGSTLPVDAADIEVLAEALCAWRQSWLSMFALLNRSTGIKNIFSAEAQTWVKTTVPELEADMLCACLAPALGVLLEQAWRGYTRLKQERGVVDFVDIITRLNHLLETRDDLRQNVRQRFGAILVDEAQDTNRLQRRMVDLLCGFAGADTHDAEQPPNGAPAQGPKTTVFVVGDWKQSIYTFRGADPQSFDDFAKAIKARGGQETTLSISRRSAPELVHGINSLGASLFTARYEPLDVLDAGDFEPTPQVAAPSALQPPSPGTYWVSLPAGEAAGTAKAAKIDPILEAQSLALWIEARLKLGAEPKDFVILLNAMTTAPAFLGALQRLGIPALVGGGSGLYAQAEILDHLALLAWLADADATLQAAVCLRSPLFGLSDSALWALLGPKARTQGRLAALRAGFWAPAPAGAGAALSDDDHQALAAAAARLPELVLAARHLGVGFLLETIDQKLDARAVYLGLDSGPQRVANIERLWRFAHAHDRALGPSLQRFVASQAQRVDEAFKEPLAQVPTAGRVAVTISTVHQSKGLQYPIVVLPRLGAGGRSTSEAVAYDRQEGIVFRLNRRNHSLKSGAWSRAQEARKQAEEDERRRLLYVAMTRAERELVFVGPPAPNLGRANFGELLKTWLASEPEMLHIAAAPIIQAEQSELSPNSIRLDVPATAPPNRRIAPPGTRFRVTVTALAHAELNEAEGDAGADADAANKADAAPAPAPATAQAQLELVAADAPLSASVQGELAHGVLSAIGELGQHDSEEDFTADMLGRFGYAADDARLGVLQHNVVAFLRSPLGRHIAELAPSARRHEMPFQLVLPCGDYTAVLHGQMDLAYADESGLTIVDFKHARPGPSDAGYLRQLDAYAYALAQLCQIETDVKCYLVYLRGMTPPVQHVASKARQKDLRVRLEAFIGRAATMGEPRAPAAFGLI